MKLIGYSQGEILNQREKTWSSFYILASKVSIFKEDKKEELEKL
jgi:hypothetical protein